ncbi:MAG: beta-lactamase family protein [Bacteroidales bacterium]|nr:beta-lactamase family protein [Bacteroidales bacterium]
MRKSIIFLLSLCVITACNPYGGLTEDLNRVMKDSDVVGLSVALVENNQIVYTHSFGVKDIDTQEPVSDGDLFRIASISKSFSATSIMQLIEQGFVTLDMDVTLLAGFPIRNPKYPDVKITLGMLLSHRSSLNDSEGYFTFDVINPDVNPNYANCYNDYEPGTQYEYCNLNFNLVGSFIEKLSGERFDQYVVGHILRPLGLYGGYCVDSLDASKFVKLYTYDEQAGKFVYDPECYEPRSERIANYKFGYDTPVFSPTGGMKISAIDLAKYMLMHMNYGTSPSGVKIINEKHSRMMQTPVHSTDTTDPDAYYGYALWNEDSYIEGETLVGHTGGAYGLRSEMFFNPEKKYGFVAICSGSRDEEILKTVIRAMRPYVKTK